MIGIGLYFSSNEMLPISLSFLSDAYSENKQIYIFQETKKKKTEEK